MPRRLLLCFALPFIGLFWFFSLTRPILPHWSAPAFSILVLFPASYLAEKQSFTDKIVKLPRPLVASLSLMVFVVALGAVEIKTGIIPINFGAESKTVAHYGENDLTSTIYGWRAIKDDFQEIREKKIAEGVMKEDDGMIHLKWFPMANLDYYVAYPLGIKMLGLRDVSEIHKYIWINEYRGGLKKGSDYWYLNLSSDSYDPTRYLVPLFNEVVPCDTIIVERCGKPQKYVFVYMCKGMK